MSSLVGRTFGDFAIRERLGAGGAGEVYLAEQLTLGRQAVIKVLARGIESSTDAQERFLREARLASKLDHPFAAHVYAFGAEADGMLWIAMELVRGTPLDRLVLEHGPVSLARFVPFFERLCEVLNAAHEQSIVHRDIKPANVMVLQRAGRLLPKLLDLGIARASTLDGAEGLAEPTSHAATPILTTATPLTEGNSITEGTLAPGTMSGSLLGRLTRSESMHLTQLGSLVGTPHYMAPEQWADASRAGPAADVYSLAILAFQCLTGRVPFEGKTLRAMAKAHASQPLPPLGDELPQALNAVLAKGAAKNVGDRFGNTLEFAAAVRAASGLGVEPVTLPQLEAGLRDNLLSEAPQPLAESVAMLEGARTSRQAVDALMGVARVLCRYLGLVALAARARVGSGNAAPGAETGRLLGQLRANGLTMTEWLSLTRELVLPFAAKENAHPVPELVRFFSDPHAGSAELFEFAGLVPPARSDPDEAAVQFLVAQTPKLGDLLERVSFVFDYSLVVGASTGAERWMGTRRVRRLNHATVTPLRPGEAALVDSVGTIVVALPPLVQCIAPSGGAPDELFLLEGPGRHGAKLVALPSAYERQDDSLWEWMEAQGLLSAASAHAVATEKAPYKGLSTFSTDDADNYFGREKEAEAFANRMRRESFLAVVGPSGTGKSSFILAGVLPLLPAAWKSLVFRPGAFPLNASRARLELDGLASLESGVEALVASIPEGETRVIVVDQFEEIVTLCQDPAARIAFAKALLEAARHPSGRIRVVVTLRDDFLIKVQQLPVFREVLSNSLQLLGTPATEDLERVVTEPARRVGFAFDDPELPRRMVEAVSEYSGALALLSFTASQLWELRDRHLRLMRVKTYDALGGVGGALANHAEATLAALSEPEQGLVREAFRHLVTAQGTRAVLSKTEALEVLGGTAVAASVLEKLVTARLLVSSESTDGNDSIEVIHEAIITAWPRLVGWQREDAESARLRDSLRASARQWKERGSPSGLLWRKETLAEYRVWRPRFPGRLTQAEEAFAEASLRDEARGVLIRRGLASTAFVALLIGLVVIFRAYRAADASATEALDRLREMRVEQGRLALLDGQPFEASLFVDAAKELGAKGPLLTSLSGALQAQLRGLHHSAVLGAPHRLVVSPGQDRVMALGPRGSAVLLSLPDLSQLEAIELQAKGPSRFVFTEDGSHGVVCRADGAIQAWEAGKALAAPGQTGGPLRDCRYLPHAQTLVVLRAGGKLSALKVDGHELTPTCEWTTGVDADLLAVSPSKTPRVAVFRQAAVAGNRSMVGLVELDHCGASKSIVTGPDRDTDASFSPDGSTLAIAGNDGLLRLYDVATGLPGVILRGHAKSLVRTAWVGPDQLLTASQDGSVRLWKTDGTVLRTLSHTAAVVGLVATTERIVVSTADGVVNVWVPDMAEPLRRYVAHANGPLSLEAVGADLLLTSGLDGLVRTWGEEAVAQTELKLPGLTYVVTSPDRRRAIAGPDGDRFTLLSLEGGVHELDAWAFSGCTTDVSLAAHFAPDTIQVASTEASRICLFDWATKTQRSIQGHEPITRLRFTADGKRLVSAGRQGRVDVWDTETLAEVRHFQHSSRVRNIALSADETLLYASTDEGKVFVWVFATGEPRFDIQAHDDAVIGLTVLANGEVVTGSRDQTAALWSSTGQLRFRLQGHETQVVAGAVNPSATVLATVDRAGSIRLWDLATGRAVGRLETGGASNDLLWLDDERLLTELGDSGWVRILTATRDTPSLDSCRVPLQLRDGEIVKRTDWSACVRGASTGH